MKKKKSLEAIKEKGFTPMMQQYLDVKNDNQDCILMYRLGDFYEMFFEDAKTVSRELDLTLTGRDCGQAERAPMCGVPYHSAEGYIARRDYRVLSGMGDRYLLGDHQMFTFQGTVEEYEAYKAKLAAERAQ